MEKKFCKHDRQNLVTNCIWGTGAIKKKDPRLKLPPRVIQEDDEEEL